MSRHGIATAKQRFAAATQPATSANNAMAAKAVLAFEAKEYCTTCSAMTPLWAL